PALRKATHAPSPAPNGRRRLSSGRVRSLVHSKADRCSTAAAASATATHKLFSCSPVRMPGQSPPYFHRETEFSASFSLRRSNEKLHTLPSARTHIPAPQPI